MWKRVLEAIVLLYAESAGGARIMSFGVHPSITGAAHRIKYFDAMLAYLKTRNDVVFWTGDQIHEWYRGQHGRQAR